MCYFDKKRLATINEAYDANGVYMVAVKSKRKSKHVRISYFVAHLSPCSRYLLHFIRIYWLFCYFVVFFRFQSHFKREQRNGMAFHCVGSYLNTVSLRNPLEMKELGMHANFLVNPDTETNTTRYAYIFGSKRMCGTVRLCE